MYAPQHSLSGSFDSIDFMDHQRSDNSPSASSFNLPNNRQPPAATSSATAASPTSSRRAPPPSSTVEAAGAIASPSDAQWAQAGPPIPVPKIPRTQMPLNLRDIPARVLENAPRPAADLTRTVDPSLPNFSSRQYAGCGRVLVCQGSKCTAKGAGSIKEVRTCCPLFLAQITCRCSCLPLPTNSFAAPTTSHPSACLASLQAVASCVGSSEGVTVLHVKCLGKCGQGPAMRVVAEGGDPRGQLYTRLHPTHVSAALDAHFLVPLPPRPPPPPSSPQEQQEPLTELS
jgi:(2Fe-2S) ferredoxin